MLLLWAYSPAPLQAGRVAYASCPRELGRCWVCGCCGLQTQELHFARVFSMAWNHLRLRAK